MRYALMVALALALLVLPLPAACEFRLVLGDGTILIVDARPEVRGGAVSFIKGGLAYTLPLARVDLPATERANGPEAPESAPSTAAPAPAASNPPAEPPKPPKRFTDEDLPSRATTPPEPAPAARTAANGSAVPSDGAGPRVGDGDLTRWASLSREEKDLQSRRREFEDRIGSLEDRRDDLDAEDARRRSDYGNYPTDPSVVAAAQFWDEEYGRRRSAIQDELADLRSGAAEIDRALREVQLEMRDLSIGP